jgi:hypothetical protein
MTTYRSEPPILPFNPEFWAEGDPLGRWKERYPGTTLDELKRLDAELFRDVLSWYASVAALAEDMGDDDGE